MAISDKKEFPNGFTSWMETHHEVVEFIAAATMENEYANGAIARTHATHGTGGVYELAEQWTDVFERLHKGREWDGEYFETIEKFLTEKADS